MAFGAFLDRIAHGDECVYMTTQNLGVDESGRPNLMASPATEVLDVQCIAYMLSLPWPMLECLQPSIFNKRIKNLQ